MHPVSHQPADGARLDILLAAFIVGEKMRFNPNKNKFKTQDDEFLAALDEIRMPYRISKLEVEAHWFTAAEEITGRARVILKREWKITKRFFVWSSTPHR